MREMMKIVLIKYGFPSETVNAIMILYKNTRSMVRSLDGDTPFFEITTGILQGDTLAPFLFIICLDYILKNSLDCNKELGFTISKSKSSSYTAVSITDSDYADDIALITYDLSEANTLLLLIEEKANEIGLKINAGNTEYMSFNHNEKTKSISKSLNGENIKKVDDFKYLGSYIGSTEHDINIRIAKAWAALNNLNIIWKSNIQRKPKNKLLESCCRNCSSLRFRNLDNDSSYGEKNWWNIYEDAKSY